MCALPRLGEVITRNARHICVRNGEKSPSKLINRRNDNKTYRSRDHCTNWQFVFNLFGLSVLGGPDHLRPTHSSGQSNAEEVSLWRRAVWLSRANHIHNSTSLLTYQFLVTSEGHAKHSRYVSMLNEFIHKSENTKSVCKVNEFRQRVLLATLSSMHCTLTSMTLRWPQSMCEITNLNIYGNELGQSSQSHPHSFE